MTKPDLIETLGQGELMKLSDHPFKLGGRDALYIGLTVTIYFAAPYGKAINERLCECIEEYIALAPAAPRLAALPLSGQWINLEKRGYIGPLQGIGKVDPKQSWSEEYIWSEGEDDASPWSVQVVRGSDKETWALGYFHGGLPIAWAMEPKLQTLVRRWSERLHVFHGYVGIAPLLPASMIAARKTETDIFLAAKRFPGLNVDIPSSQRGPLMKGIKTVDWITLLGKQYVEQLGGVSALGSKLGPDFALAPLGHGGLMIRAGALPELGDLMKKDRPALYVKLNRELRPVRVVDYPYSFQSGQFCEHYMDRKAANEWIARFDQVVDH